MELTYLKGKSHKSRNGFQKGHKINIGRASWNKGLHGIKTSNKGTKFSEETKKKMSESHKGKMPKNIDTIKGWNKGLKGIKHSIEWRKEISKKLMGENNPAWKGGFFNSNKKQRQILDYKLWQKSVFERDNYECCCCLKRGGIIHAHHIIGFNNYPEQRFDVTNGLTLCKECHMNLHGLNKKEEICLIN